MGSEAIRPEICVQTAGEGKTAMKVAQLVESLTSMRRRFRREDPEFKVQGSSKLLGSMKPFLPPLPHHHHKKRGEGEGKAETPTGRHEGGVQEK